jgi:hypothetical protein
LRAGWSIGDVQQRYIFTTNGADQFVGRCAVGLDINSPTFAQLPPHFAVTVLNDGEWRQFVPGYDNLPAEFRPVLPFLLASLVYHLPFLQRTMSSHHSFWISKIVQSGYLGVDGIPTSAGVILNNVVLCGMFSNSTSRMVATGIPPNVYIYNKLEDLNQKHRKSHALMLDKFDELKSVIANDLPEHLKKLMLENFIVNGAVPVTQAQLDSTIELCFRNLILPQLKVFAAGVGDEEIQHDVMKIHQNEQFLESALFKSFEWKGKFRQVPEDFIFPVGKLNELFDLWYCGNFNLKIVPYCKLQPNIDLKELKQCANACGNFSKAKFVFSQFEEIATAKGLIPSSNSNFIREMVPEKRMSLFIDCFVSLLSKVHNLEEEKLKQELQAGKSKWSDASYVTLYEKLKQPKRKHTISPTE